MSLDCKAAGVLPGIPWHGEKRHAAVFGEPHDQRMLWSPDETERR